MKQGKLIIFSAPSGAGKTTIVKHLLQKFPCLSFSISATTRELRGSEQHENDYYFITKEDFLHRVARQEFVEFEEVYNGTFYGTLRSEIERIWNEDKHVIFDIDVEGGLRLKRKYEEDDFCSATISGSAEGAIKRQGNRQPGKASGTVYKGGERT
jgi:guanylate kinase